MKKFKSKVVTIEAEQFLPEVTPWPPGVEAGGMEGKNDKPTHYVETKSGTASVVRTDWIVKELDGSGYYPVDEKTFSAKYEAAE